MKKFATPLQIDIRPSLTFLVLIFFLHITSLITTWMLVVAWQIKVVIFLLVIINLYWVLYKRGVRVPYSTSLFGSLYCRIVWGSDNDWQLIKFDGNKYQASLLGSSYVHRQLLVLNFKINGKSWYNRYQTFVLLPDCVDADCFRRLCARLRLVRGRLVENSLV